MRSLHSMCVRVRTCPYVELSTGCDVGIVECLHEDLKDKEDSKCADKEAINLKCLQNCIFYFVFKVNLLPLLFSFLLSDTVSCTRIK